MKGRILILAFISVLFLVRCKPKEIESTTIPEIKIPVAIPQTDLPNSRPPDLVEYEGASSIYGEWFNIYSDHPRKLIFNRDGTFQYINENESGDSLKGKWVANGSEYILRGQLKGEKNESLNSKEGFLLFERKFRFKDGFVYEVNKDGSLSNDYFLQSKNYR